MSKSYAGGCACGAIRYDMSGSPIFENHCQCRDCQRQSGTGHSSYLTFAGRAGQTLVGTPSQWRLTADSGTQKVHAFCPVCGSPVYLTFPAMPDLIAITAASLDEPDRFTPQALTYALRGFPWDLIDPHVPAFDRMPPR